MEEDRNLKEQSVLDKINQRLRDMFLPGTKLSSQEEILMNIVYKILNASGTIKMTPPGGEYFLINYPLHYFVKIQGGRINIVNTVDSVVRDCSAGFEMAVKKAIDEALCRDIEKLDSTVFNNEIKLLEKMELKVSE